MITGCGKRETNNEVLPTKTDDSQIEATPANDAYPSIMIDGKVYRYYGSEDDLTIEEDYLADYYLGDIESSIDLSYLPENNNESNFAPVGSKVYSNYDDGDTVILVWKDDMLKKRISVCR